MKKIWMKLPKKLKLRYQVKTGEKLKIYFKYNELKKYEHRKQSQ